LALDNIGELPIRSFTQRIDRASTTSTGGGGSKPVFSSIEIVRDADFHSPEVNRIGASGTHLQNATILLPGSGLKIRLKNLIIDDVGIETTQNGVPQEHVGLAFSHIEWEWSNGGPSSVVEFDVLTNVGGGGAGAEINDFVFFGQGVPVQPEAGESQFTKLTVSTTSTPVLGTGGGGTKPSFSPLTIQTGFSGGSLPHISAAATGIHIPRVNARFTALDNNGAVFAPLTYSVLGATVTSLALATTPSGAIQETLGLDYQQIRWLGTPPDGGASHQAAWDLAQNREP